jgi:quercetin dioxygenase-like cupin family protein
MKKVDKPWGYELIFAHTDNYVGKILHINKNERLSLQYHKIKEETIYLSQGLMRLEIEKDGNMVELLLRRGEYFHISPGIKHRFSALEECELFEVSTPHLDDVVRLEDQYGRV